MREKIIERRLAEAIKKMGGICPKFVSPGFDGMPDRIALLPDGKAGFIEVKAAGKKSRAIQLRRHEQLQRLGFKVYIVDRAEQIGEIINEIQTT